MVLSGAYKFFLGRVETRAKICLTFLRDFACVISTSPQKEQQLH